MSQRAEQLEFFAVPSPCVGVCTIDDKGYCQGCMRKREERFNWLNYTPAQQLHVIKECRQRYRRKILQGRFPRDELKIDEENSIELQDDLFATIKQYVDTQDLNLSKKIEKEIKEVLDDTRDIDSLSHPAIKALFIIIMEIFLPFVVSCLAAVFMEQSDFVRDIFRDVPKEQLKQEIKNQEFTEKYKNFSVIIRNDIMRRDPSSKGEVVAFLDVGDVVEVLDIYNNWVYIRVEVGDDIETGWIVKGVSQRLNIRTI